MQTARRMGFPLPALTKARLIYDIDKNPSATFAEIVQLKPDLYGGAFRAATRTHYGYLTGLKRHNELRFLQRLGAALQLLLDDVLAQAFAEADRQALPPIFQLEYVGQ